MWQPLRSQAPGWATLTCCYMHKLLCDLRLLASLSVSWAEALCQLEGAMASSVYVTNG